MNKIILYFIFLILIIFSSCNKTEDVVNGGTSTKLIKNISYNNVAVDIVIHKPENTLVDVLLVFHGTVTYDSAILESANNTLDKFKGILNRNDMMIVSVAYPEENLFIGDNIAHAEAALLWVKNNANQELGITVNKIFLAGHSQGGYLVTRLNTMHQTNGVIANGPGPLSLMYRCQLEENGQAPNSIACTLLNTSFGSTTSNPNAYSQRSLLNFTNGYKSDILFVQGMNDTQIQMYSWPTFKQQVNNCTNCQETQFLELPNFGHTALFESSVAKEQFNVFINSR